MERFNLTRHDLMCMSWTQLIMAFESVQDEESEEDSSDAPRAATAQDYSNWI